MNANENVNVNPDDLNPNAVLLLRHIAERTAHYGPFFKFRVQSTYPLCLAVDGTETMDNAARVATLTPSQVRRAVAELVQSGLLLAEKSFNGRNSSYLLNTPDAAAARREAEAKIDRDLAATDAVVELLAKRGVQARAVGGMVNVASASDLLAILQAAEVRS